MITGVVLYLPSVVLILFLAHQFYGHDAAGTARFAASFRLPRADRFSLVRPLIIAAVVNSSQESNILIQPIYMAMLFLSGATIPITFMPHWLQNITQIRPRDLSNDRDRWYHAARRIVARQLAGGRRLSCSRPQLVDLYRDEALSLGEGGKAARFSQTLGAGGVASRSLPWRSPGMESARSGQGADSRAISGAGKPG